VLLAIRERRWRIETGYGIEGILPDGLCGEIGRNYMVPYFKEGKYGEGMYYGVTAIAKLIAKDAHVSISILKDTGIKEQSKGPDWSVGFSNQPKIYLFGVVIVSAFFSLIIFHWILQASLLLGLVSVIALAILVLAEFHSLFFGLSIITAYLICLFLRLIFWLRIPSMARKRFFDEQRYLSERYGGPPHSGIFRSGGFGGGGFGGGGFGGGGFGGGGFGGGGGGGGGAGGGF